MIEIFRFLFTPIFYLTPYIFIWSILNGLITVGLLKSAKVGLAREALIATAFSTAIASIFWNWSIEFNQSTIVLNVDHPLLRVSWADLLNSVCVFALNAFTLGMFVCKREPARLVAKVAGFAAFITILTDTFLF